MNAAGRLGAYAAGLAVVFAGSFAAGGALVPYETVSAWKQQAEELRMDQHPAPAESPEPADTDDDH
ncbi:hypothetical protein ACQ3I4_15630 [Zafaria sp. Z1313]|uniref:hypothetical protein n=1 Tax=unclassified Zafaria TaxID=2828765 RepID=UPI002E765DB2|nr:hypothetical protein [Zafaria sp. J156]MEE1622651.1 hypothetical protein [Zafaria sp. J156]